METVRRAGVRRRTTMTQVAKRAGVSQATVSFVLNDRQDIAISAATRARVLQAAKELNFRPNRAAQALRSNRSFTIAVVTDRVVAEPYAGQIILGIQQTVQPAGYLCFVIETAHTPDDGAQAVRNLLAQGVAGIVYAAPSPEAIAVVTAPDDARTVFVNCWPEQAADAAVVLADEYGGGLAVAQAVFRAGHRRVAFLGGPRDEYACGERERGFLDAARAAGIPADTLTRAYGTYHISSGYDLTLKTLDTPTRPTALVCGNDRMAVGALMALGSLGLRCPDDVSITGFDNQPDVADQVHPALTTVALPHFEMGRIAGAQLVAGEIQPGRQLVPCEYIPRESLKPAR